MRALVPQPDFAAGDAVAVIAEEEDNRVVRQAVVVQHLQQRAELAVHLRDPVVILGPDLAHRRRVGMIGRHVELGGIVNASARLGLAWQVWPWRRFPAGRALAILTLVRAGEVDLAEERLAGCALTPFDFLGTDLVPRLVLRLEVVVELRAAAATAVERIVAGRPQQRRESTSPAPGSPTSCRDAETCRAASDRRPWPAPTGWASSTDEPRSS